MLTQEINKTSNSISNNEYIKINKKIQDILIELEYNNLNIDIIVN